MQASYPNRPFSPGAFPELVSGQEVGVAVGRIGSLVGKPVLFGPLDLRAGPVKRTAPGRLSELAG